MEKFVNLSILRNPLNWLTIGGMIVFVIMAGFVIYSRCNSDTPLNGGSSTLSKET
jgi:Ni,Fe-hydrogenase I cytochrome b subunit